MKPASSDQGFVLPAVLGYIAAFMLVVLLAAGALDRARSATQDLEAQTRLQSALDDIEARAVYTYLAATPVPGGAELFRTQAFDASAVVLGEAPAPVQGAPAPRIWTANGGELVFSAGNVRASVRYRDAGGLVSLNSSDPSILAALLENFGASSDDAIGLAAALRDYIDEDSLRRPRGGEAADYRLRQLPVPTNSPLRDISELRSVLGWRDAAYLSRLDFIEQVTISLTAPEPRWTFAPPEIAQLQPSLSPLSLSTIDPIAGASSLHSFPGGRARLTLLAVDMTSRVARLRIIEIERQPTALTAPHSRVVVYEAGYSGPLPESLVSRDTEILELFGATPG